MYLLPFFSGKAAVLGVLGWLCCRWGGPQARLWAHLPRELHRALATAPRHLPGVPVSML